jgi:hypothetical protein
MPAGCILGNVEPHSASDSPDIGLMRPSFSLARARRARAAQRAERVVLEQKLRAEGCELNNVTSHSASVYPQIEKCAPVLAEPMVGKRSLFI